MILLDTNVLVGLVDHRDSHNARATADLNRLRRHRLGLTTPVLAETCSFLRHHTQRDRLRRVIHDLSISTYPLPDESALWRNVFQWFSDYAEHAPDWTDAVLVVLSSIDRRVRIWTYDKEFTTTWRRADGSRVPMAVPR